MHPRIRFRAWIVLAGLAGGGPGGCDEPSEALRYRTEDGFTIVADLHLPGEAGGSPPPLVVLSHQLGRDRTSWEPLVPRLLGAGYAVLALDVRSLGESTREVASPAGLDNRQKDGLHLDLLGGIEAAAREAATRGGAVDTARVAIVAAGLSVAPAGRAVQERTSVRALVLLSGSVEPPEEAFLAHHPEVALLYAAAAGDERGAAAVRRQAEHLAGPSTELYVLENGPAGEPAAWSGTDGLTDDTGLLDLIVWFLQRHVPPAAPSVSQ